MYKSGQHLTETINTTPLKLNLDFLKPGYENTVKHTEETKNELQTETENFDYNFFME